MSYQLSNERGTCRAYGLPFLVTAVVTSIMLSVTSLHYGFAKNNAQARAISRSLVESIDAQGHLPPREALEAILRNFSDVVSIQACSGAACLTRQRNVAPARTMLATGNGGQSCATTMAAGHPDRRAHVCLSPTDLYQDLGRDLSILLFAQVVGFLIWEASTRGFRRRAEQWRQEVTRAATTDALTGLLNRNAFSAALQRACASTQASGWLLLLDLNGFKSINDQYGHAAGDFVIEAIGGRLQERLDGTAQVARLGGDEFAVLAASSEARETTAPLFRLVMAAFERPVLYDGMAFEVSCSVGAAEIDGNVSATEVQRRADVAMYAAKRQSDSHCAVFDKSYDAGMRAEYALRADLFKALDRREIDVVYQPLFDATGRPVAAEALARWRHERLGPIAPDVFIRVAEGAGVIRRLGQLVVEKVCQDLVRLREAGAAVQYIAVNVSPQEIASPTLVDDLLRVLDLNGLAACDLELELTESSIMTSDDKGERQLQRLAAAGFSIAIDDFGTGHSSLARLQTMPASKLKLDRSFIQALHTRNGQLLVETMLSLAHRLGLTCVAEGVENQEQVAWLRAHRCELLQGYHLARPMSATEFIGIRRLNLDHEFSFDI